MAIISKYHNQIKFATSIYIKIVQTEQKYLDT